MIIELYDFSHHHILCHLLYFGFICENLSLLLVWTLSRNFSFSPLQSSLVILATHVDLEDDTFLNWSDMPLSSSIWSDGRGHPCMFSSPFFLLSSSVFSFFNCSVPDKFNILYNDIWSPPWISYGASLVTLWDFAAESLLFYFFYFNVHQHMSGRI